MKITAKGAMPVENAVFEYGLRVDRDCLPVLKDQFKLAHDTYNEIVSELKRIAREAKDWLEEQAGDDARLLRTRIDLLNVAFKEAKAEDNRERLEVIANERRGLWREYYDRINEVRISRRSELNALFEDQVAERKACRIYQIRCEAVKRGLGWATANVVLKSAIQAWRKQWPKLKEPNYRRIAEVTQQLVELQFASGIVPVDAITGARHSEVAIGGAAAGRRQYSEFRMRVGAGETRSDVTGTIHVHRPLPVDARVLRARLVEKRVGKDRKYYAQFALEFGAGAGPTIPVPESRNPLVALDFGWYYEDDGRRIAGVADGPDPGMARIFRFPQELERLFEKAEAIESERARLRDEVAGEILAMTFKEAPESLADDLARIKRCRKPEWVAPARLAGVVLRWRETCPDYLPEWIERLESWRQRDKALWQAATHTARRARNRRRKFYEAQALQLCSQYERVVIDTPDLAQTAKVKNKTTGKHNKLGAMARSGRHRVALSEFRRILEWAASRSGVTVADIVGRTSKTCAHCGGVAVVDDDNSRIVRCDSAECGAVEDRELNAAAVCYRTAFSRIEEIDRMHREGSEHKALQFAKRKSRQATRQLARWSVKDDTVDDDQDRTDLREPEAALIFQEVRAESFESIIDVGGVLPGISAGFTPKQGGSRNLCENADKNNELNANG